ncbi:hypothetical protein Q5N30_05585 [Vibrio cholerae]|uniref:hypothetical protein n=1 Tax=Vibrio cholerae TaxID=666 RepID=UPI002934CC54|nr:hypothetical protein [Vibrio cholerae]MDV2306033.1 hypothetical protein [Vibrio cholerae]
MNNEINDTLKKISSYNNNKKQHIITMLHKHYYISEIDSYSIKDQHINEKILSALTNSHKDDIKEINNILDKFVMTLIDDHYISLLLDDKVFSIFCYIHLSNNDVFNVNEKYIFNKSKKVMHTIYRFNSYSSLSQTNTILKATNDIINFLNNIECSNIDKENYLKYLLNKYNRSKKENSFNWLQTKDKGLDRWCIDYYSKNETIENKCKRIPSLFRDERNFNVTIPAIFHALEISNAEKQLFLINMKKAWGQKKYREKIKQDNKKTLNLVVDGIIDKKLKHLSKEFDEPVNKIVSMMTIYLADKYEEIKELEKENKKKKRKILKSYVNDGPY